MFSYFPTGNLTLWICKQMIANAVANSILYSIDFTGCMVNLTNVVYADSVEIYKSTALNYGNFCLHLFALLKPFFKTI